MHMQAVHDTLTPPRVVPFLLKEVERKAEQPLQIPSPGRTAAVRTDPRAATAGHGRATQSDDQEEGEGRRRRRVGGPRVAHVAAFHSGSILISGARRVNTLEGASRPPAAAAGGARRLLRGARSHAVQSRFIHMPSH